MPTTPEVNDVRVSPTRLYGLDLPRRRHTVGSLRPAEELGQPQDGVSLSRGDLAGTVAAFASREAEDARLTGGTRSLMRRVLGLNVTKPAMKSKRLCTPILKQISAV